MYRIITLLNYKGCPAKDIPVAISPENDIQILFFFSLFPLRLAGTRTKDIKNFK